MLWNRGVPFCNTLSRTYSLFSKRTKITVEEKKEDNNGSIFTSILSGFCDVTSVNFRKGRWERPRGSSHTRLLYMLPLFHLTQLSPSLFKRGKEKDMNSSCLLYCRLDRIYQRENFTYGIWETFIITGHGTNWHGLVPGAIPTVDLHI